MWSKDVREGIQSGADIRTHTAHVTEFNDILDE